MSESIEIWYTTEGTGVDKITPTELDRRVRSMESNGATFEFDGDTRNRLEHLVGRIVDDGPSDIEFEIDHIDLETVKIPEGFENDCTKHEALNTILDDRPWSSLELAARAHGVNLRLREPEGEQLSIINPNPQTHGEQ